MQTQANQTWKILLVEDDEDDAFLVQQMLAAVPQNQFIVEWADQYDQALTKLTLGDFDAALLDYNLGPRTGLELLRAANAQGTAIPMIFLTGMSSYQIDLEAMHAGAADYLSKQEMSPATLERSIRYAVERRRAEDALDVMREEQIAQKAHAEVQRLLMQHREDERLQIARDLHDGPLQEMIALNFHLREALEIQDPAEREERMALLQRMIQDQIRDLRTFCGELRPPTLAHFGLARAIAAHAEGFQEKYPLIKIQMELADDGRTLPETTRLALFRIYQEVLNNVVKHSGADEITVELSLTEHHLELTIQDNGSGFDVPNGWVDLARRGHFGLIGIYERIEALGGQVSLSSEPGEGTIIRITTPIPVHA